MSNDQPFHPGESLAPANRRTLEGGAPVRLRLACAWCGEIIEDGPGPVSHGMCPKCSAVFLAAAPGE